MTSQPSERYRFGSFELSVGERELRRGDELIPLTGKTFDLLLALVLGTGRTLTKSELMAALWPDTVVDESNLTQTIFLLRKALGNGTDESGYIRTVPRRGYKFDLPVTLTPGGTDQAEVKRPRRRRFRLTASAAVLMLAAGAIFFWLRTRTTPMTDQDVLVLADFTNSTGDPVFDGTLRDALAFQLEQSPFLKVLDDGVMRQELQQMRRSPQEHITNDLARDICVREAEKAMLGGSIASLGKSYAIELKTTNCQTGATLAREHAEAADKEHVLQALAKAAQGMRAKLGESLSSIQELAPRNEDDALTTGSLEAFQAFHTGLQLYAQGRNSEAVPVLLRATELDPDLAFGWIWLAGAYYNSGGSRERYHEYLDKAWALRDRVSARERLWIISNKEGQSTGQYIQNFENWARTYPRDPMPPTFLGRVHQSAGEFEKALANFQEVYRLYRLAFPPLAIEVIGLIMTYGQLDRFDEAKALAEEMFAQGEDAPLLHQQLLWIAYAQGDRGSAVKHIGWFVGKPEEYRSLAAQGAEARVRGELRQSRELLERAADLARLRNLPDAAAGFLKPDPGGDALIGNCGTARRTGALSDSSLDRVDLPTVIPANHTGDAVLALCGNQVLAERAEELNKRWVSSIYKTPAQVPLTRAAAQLGLGHPDKAIELLQSVARYERAYPMSNYIRGLAYLCLRRGGEATAEFQKILDHRGANWGPLYPLSYVGVARGAALVGDTARARKAYQDFFALWKDADPDLPILIQARKEYTALNR